VERLEVLRTKALVDRGILEHVADRGGHGGGAGLLVDAAGFDAVVLNLQVAVCLFGRCRLHRRGLEPVGAFAHAIGAAFADTFVVART
jgi:hypothetical protein